MTDYETIPYVGLPIPTAHPWRMLWTSTVFGGPRPDLSRARVLELGCGDGATLLPIAAFEPQWVARGIDFSPRAIECARNGAAQSELANVAFACGDVANVAVEEGAWDVVIAHGLYSWIDPERQSALRRLIRRALAPAGLAYVSFNAQPGWAARGVVRDVLRRARPDDPRTFLDRLAELAGDLPWAQLLKRELLFARDARPDHLVHDYLEEDNHAFWLQDFVRDAAGSGLRWIGDSQFDPREGRAAEIRASLGVDALHADELADLLGYRQLRCAILARDDAPLHSPLDDDVILRTAIVAGALAPTRDPFVLDASEPERMRTPSGMEVDVDNPLGKAALLELAVAYPAGFRFDELLAHARQVLDRHRIPRTAEDEREVAEGVLRLWRAGALDLRLHRPSVRVEPTQRLKVRPITRYEASLRSLASTAIDVIALEPGDRELVQLMDGSRTAAELAADDAGRANVDRLVEAFARWGLFVTE